MKEVESFLHEHPLRLSTSRELWAPRGAKYFILNDERRKCHACWKTLVPGQFYKCREGEKFSIHKSCLETDLPQKIEKHFLHPSCPLSLKICGLSPTHNESCVFCNRKGFIYKCERCWFCICPDCSGQHIPKPGSGEEKILRSSHRHPLTLVDKEYGGFSLSSKCCRVCRGLFSRNPGSPTYQCSDCQIAFHKSCLDMLPPKIRHSSHPSCPLIRVATSRRQCSDCQEFTEDGDPMFCCGKCQFRLCGPCWLMPVVKSQQSKSIQRSLSWWSSVTLREKKYFEEASNCLVCQKPCMGRIYGFITGGHGEKLFLHESCAEIPRRLDLISHPQQELRYFKSKVGLSGRCYWCRNDCGYLAFTCSSQSTNSCDPVLCVGCAYVKPSIMSSNHKHPLSALENVYDDELKCQACHVSCKSSPAMRCQQLGCNYTLHLSCGPLPCTIKPPCHVHPLTLKYYHVEDVNDDEDNFCCHVCEERRDPQFPVYYCAQGCPMVSEVKCLLPELLPLLRGERGDVELQTVGKPHISSKVVSSDYLKERCGTPSGALTLPEKLEGADLIQSLLHIFGSSSKYEIDKIRFISNSLRGLMLRISIEREEWNGPKFAYSEKALSKFMTKLDDFSVSYADTVPDFLSEHDKFVNVGDVRVASTLVNTYQDLLHTCGDIGRRSRVKSFAFWILCGVIYSMQATKVAHITERRLQEWWYWLRWVEFTGFEIQFVMDHMKWVAHAYFGVQARKYLKETKAKNERRLQQITNKMKELEWERETIKKQEQNLEISEREAKNISSLKLCVENAQAMQWKPAAESYELHEAWWVYNVQKKLGIRRWMKGATRHRV